MRGLNKVTLIGNVGKEPEIQTLEGNVKVAKLSLATEENFKDDKGQNHSATEWHTIICWRGLADIVEKYIKKGSLLYVEGKIKTRSYDDKTSGQKRYVTEIIADNVILLDKKKADI